MRRERKRGRREKGRGGPVRRKRKWRSKERRNRRKGKERRRGEGRGEQTGERKETEEEEARREGRTRLCKKLHIQKVCDPDPQVKINKDCSNRVLIWQLTQEWN